jgi:hypothetical protein
MIAISNLVSTLCITFLIFVSWKKGPEKWLKISPLIFFSMLVTNYLILPIINIVVALYLIIDPNVDLRNFPIESYIVFFLVVSTGRILEYFTLIRRTVVLDAKNYLQLRDENKNKAEIEKELL